MGLTRRGYTVAGVLQPHEGHVGPQHARLYPCVPDDRSPPVCYQPLHGPCVCVRARAPAPPGPHGRQLAQAMLAVPLLLFLLNIWQHLVEVLLTQDSRKLV